MHFNAATDTWQRAILGDDSRRSSEVALAELLDKCGDIDIYGTRRNASWILTIQTARGLQLCLLGIIAIAHLFKIGGTYRGILLAYAYTGNLICHSL